MDLQSFEQLAAKNPTGLVRMKFVEDHTPYPAGSVAGFYPDKAFEMFSGREALPADESGEPIATFPDDTLVEEAAPVVVSDVEIPDDWEQQHHLRRVGIAKEIRGSADSLTVQAADEIIRAELQRRKEQP